MGIKLNSQWKSIREPQFACEREALEFMRDRLPDHDRTRAWANFEFNSDHGLTRKVNVMVLRRSAIHTPTASLLRHVARGNR
jgi:hypothetical protein